MRWLLACALALCLAAPGLAAERLDLTVPFQLPPAPAPPAVAWWRVSHIHFGWDESRIYVGLVGSGGQRMECMVADSEAATLMRNLATADLRANSLHRRALAYVSNMCVQAGTVSGSPD